MIVRDLAGYAEAFKLMMEIKAAPGNSGRKFEIRRQKVDPLFGEVYELVEVA